MAGVEGIEPTSAVLETVILPLNYTPMVAWLSFLRLPQALLTVHPLYKQTSHFHLKLLTIRIMIVDITKYLLQ